jgi:hypothetical protein
MGLVPFAETLSTPIKVEECFLGPHRNTLPGIQQVVMLGELAVNRVLG